MTTAFHKLIFISILINKITTLIKLNPITWMLQLFGKFKIYFLKLTKVPLTSKFKHRQDSNPGFCMSVFDIVHSLSTQKKETWKIYAWKIGVIRITEKNWTSKILYTRILQIRPILNQMCKPLMSNLYIIIWVDYISV